MAVHKLEPLNDKVVLLQTEFKDRLASGLYTAHAKEAKQHVCRVIAVGPGAINEATGEFKPTKLKPGDVVIVGKYSGELITLEGVDFMVMREEQVIGILHDADVKVDEEKAAVIQAVYAGA